MERRMIKNLLCMERPEPRACPLIQPQPDCYNALWFTAGVLDVHRQQSNRLPGDCQEAQHLRRNAIESAPAPEE